MKPTMITAALAFAAAAFAPALAGSAEKTDAAELAAYTRTGKTENCLRARQVDQMKILNRHQILVTLRGGAAYLNEPNCNLSKSYALQYEVAAGQICNTTIVKLVDSGSPSPVMGSCGLGDFQELAKAPAPE